jgi:putative phosphoribosyl transferase
VVVASEIASALNAPLDVLIVRKLGSPHQPELAIGAVADGSAPRVVLNDHVIRMVGADDQYIQREIAGQLEEIQRRTQLYRHGRAALPIQDRTVVVVDDGIATGATVRAGLQALRQASPRWLVLAVPVAPPDTVEQMRAEVDELACLHTPHDFRAVGGYYEDFSQTTDEEVIALLDQFAGSEV